MNGKKVLITGAGGVVGDCLVKNFLNSVGYLSSNLDVTNALQVHRVLSIEKPDIIIHTAAFTNVEACEVEIDKAFKVNTIGTQNLVNYCIDKDVLFVFISSTGIYGAHKTECYTEFDKVEPLTIHHKSKYEAERIVEKHINKHLILRTGWIFGGSTLHKKNFVHQRYLEANNNSLIYSDNSQIGNPTYALDLVEQIKVLINANQFGLYNCVNYAKGISRYDYVKKIIELFSLDCKVEMAPKGMFERLAPVSDNESASNLKLELLNLNCMGNWDDALSRYVEFLKLNKIDA
jgi:dTDP-4-dehydrorhamnose reductase